MNIKQKYGTIIYGDNTISKTTIYQFIDETSLEELWNDRKEYGEGEWTAHLDRGTIEHKQYVDASEYFTRSEEE